jgi:FixJ family two-component response regulator
MPTSPSGTPTVFVVDGDRQTRKSVVALSEGLRFQVCAFCGPAAFRKTYRAETPGCLVLDIQSPRQSGIELYQQLLTEGKRLPVIFLTSRADVPTAVAAMKAGAVDVLEKPLDRQMLVERIQAAFSLDAQWRAAESSFADLSGRVARLNDRDRETLELIRAGDTNKAIAIKLLLTERAVEMRRASMMRKLKVRSVAELIELMATHRVFEELRKVSQQAFG